MRPRRQIGRDPYAIDVYLDEATPLELKTFHCLGCGFVVFQYFTRVELVIASTTISPKNQVMMEIEGEKVKPPVIIQCHSHSCRVRYNIR